MGKIAKGKNRCGNNPGWKRSSGETTKGGKEPGWKRLGWKEPSVVKNEGEKERMEDTGVQNTGGEDRRSIDRWQKTKGEKRPMAKDQRGEKTLHPTSSSSLQL